MFVFMKYEIGEITPSQFKWILFLKQLPGLTAGGLASAKSKEKVLQLLHFQSSFFLSNETNKM